MTQEVAVGVAAETNEVTNLLGSWINGTSTRPVPRAIFLSGFPYDGVTVATNGNSNIHPPPPKLAVPDSLKYPT